MFVRSYQEMLQLEAQERYEMDMATLLKAGEARCEARGIEKGALKRSLETAKAMLNAGEPLERIKLYTQLIDDQITALQ